MVAKIDPQVPRRTTTRDIKPRTPPAYGIRMLALADEDGLADKDDIDSGWYRPFDPPPIEPGAAEAGHCPPARPSPATRSADPAVPLATGAKRRGRRAVSPAAQLKALKAELTAAVAALDDCRRTLNTAARTSYEHAVRVGRLLITAKGLLTHGRYTPWIAANLPQISARTARVYAQLAREEDRLPKRQPTAVFTIARVLKALPRPESEEAPGRGGATKSSRTRRDRPRDDARAGAAEAGAQTTGADDRTGADPGAAPAVTRAARPDSPEEIDRAGDIAGDSEVDVAVESPSAVAAPAEQSADEAWLASLPLRSRLADPSIFDGEALLWRRLQPVRDQLLRLHRPSPDEVGKARVNSFLRKRYAFVVVLLAGVLPPERWRVCDLCQGTGRSSSLDKECDPCWGAGFAIALEGNVPGDSVDSPA